MEDVKDLSVELEKWHKYKPVYKIEFTKNGKRISFSKSYSYPSVFVIIFNKTCQKLVLVKQWRVDNMFASIRENVSEPTVDDHQKLNEICKGNYYKEISSENFTKILLGNIIANFNNHFQGFFFQV